MRGKQLGSHHYGTGGSSDISVDVNMEGCAWLKGLLQLRGSQYE